ncbi:MAG: histidine kinase [Balneolaceae bacterium]
MELHKFYNTGVHLRLKKVLFNEISVFVYLWLAYLFLPLLTDLDDFDIDFDDLAITAYSILLVSINNFALIPRFLSKGKYIRYTVCVLVVLLLFSFLYETIVEYLFGWDDDLDIAFDGLEDSLIEMGTLLLLFGVFKLIWDHQERTTKITVLEKERVQNELKFLKSQINPHVIFNHLNSIYYFALEKSDKVPKMILKLSDLMRYTLYEANEEFVTLEKEIEYIRSYISLEKIRFEDQGSITFEVEGRTDHYRIAPLLLIPFIENSFKHSRQAAPEKVVISIKIRIDDDTLDFTVINNRSEDERMDTNDPSGIGLQNVKKRLQLIYPEKHSLLIKNTAEFFIVHLNINFLNE